MSLQFDDIYAFISCHVLEFPHMHHFLENQVSTKSILRCVYHVLSILRCDLKKSSKKLKIFVESLEYWEMRENVLFLRK